jgi:hypothetical protein
MLLKVTLLARCVCGIFPLIPFRESLMQHWVIYTPELKASIILITSPLTMIVALWGMTSERILQVMKNRAHGAELLMMDAHGTR